MFTFRINVAAAEFAQRLEFYQRCTSDELGAAATGPVVFVFLSSAAASQRYCYCSSDRSESCSHGGAHWSIGVLLALHAAQRSQNYNERILLVETLPSFVNQPALELLLVC